MRTTSEYIDRASKAYTPGTKAEPKAPWSRLAAHAAFDFYTDFFRTSLDRRDINELEFVVSEIEELIATIASGRGQPADFKASVRCGMLAAEVEDKDREIESLKALLAEARKMTELHVVETCRERADRTFCEGRIRTLEGDLSAEQRKTEELQAEVANKDSNIDALLAERRKYREELARLRSELTRTTGRAYEASEEARWTKDALEAEERKTARLEKEIAVLLGQVGDGLDESQEAQGEIRRLKAQIDENQQDFNEEETRYLNEIADLRDNLAVLKALTTNDWSGVTGGMVSRARKAGLLPRDILVDWRKSMRNLEWMTLEGMLPPDSRLSLDPESLREGDAD